MLIFCLYDHIAGMLNIDSQDLRSQLSREQDTARQINLQNDLEARNMRTRTDRLVLCYNFLH